MTSRTDPPCILHVSPTIDRTWHHMCHSQSKHLRGIGRDGHKPHGGQKMRRRVMCCPFPDTKLSTLAAMSNQSHTAETVDLSGSLKDTCVPVKTLLYPAVFEGSPIKQLGFRIRNPVCVQPKNAIAGASLKPALQISGSPLQGFGPHKRQI